MLGIAFIVASFGVFVSVGLILLAFFAKDKQGKREKPFVRLAWIVSLVSIILLVGSYVLTDFVSKKYYEETIQTAEYELVAFRDNGEYVYVSTHNPKVYSFYYKKTDGVYKKGEIFSSGNVVIYEKGDCKPKIKEYTTYTKLDISRFFQFILMFGYVDQKEKSYEIFLPKGSIMK